MHKKATWLLIAMLLAVVPVVFGEEAKEIYEAATSRRHTRLDGMTIEPVSYPVPRPTSGDHWPWVVPAGFYTQPISYEILVHNLEHGHIVTYYNPHTVKKEHLDALRQLAKKYTHPWFSFLAVPDLSIGYAQATAWEYRLNLDSSSFDKLEAFIDSHGGRGPEHPIR